MRVMVVDMAIAMDGYGTYPYSRIGSVFVPVGKHEACLPSSEYRCAVEKKRTTSSTTAMAVASSCL